MNDDIFFGFISAALTVKCWSDFVPEKEPLPAVSFIHISSPITRILDGSKTGKYHTWRVSLFANTDAELKGLVNQLESLDNTSNSDYQKVFVLFTKRLPNDSEDQKFFSAIVDIQTYEG